MATETFHAMICKTLASVCCCEVGSDCVSMLSTDGDHFHFQAAPDNGAENVTVHSVDGDVADLIGSPLVMAEAVTNAGGEPKPEAELSLGDDSWTWTFYKFATVKGSVTLTWLGMSNGFYTERVAFQHFKPGEG